MSMDSFHLKLFWKVFQLLFMFLEIINLIIKILKNKYLLKNYNKIKIQNFHSQFVLFIKVQHFKPIIFKLLE